MDSAAAATAPTQNMTPPAYYRAFAADTKSAFIFRELDRFLTIENYNGLTLQILPSVYERARAYLQTASERMILPEPEFTSDGDGGIDIEWENGGRHLALSCDATPSQPDFISWREPQGRYEGREASQDLLNRRLDWLTS